jgi:1-acyl-sn-glycerol-3-phosphate acyltransferase
MIAIRLARVILHLLAGLWTCWLVFPRLDQGGRNARIQRWSARLLALCGVSLETVGSPHVDHGALVVANHVSWLDIFVINAAAPCRFVAKSDIRDWPLIGRLVAAAGTVFIARGRQRDVRRIYEGLVSSIQAGDRVAFFPEGTTEAQGGLLPFHANLFEAAIEARAQVWPYALRYETASGELHPAVDFVGDMTFAGSMIAILRAGGIKASLIALPAIDTTGAHRRDLASAARLSIAQALDVAI